MDVQPTIGAWLRHNSLRRLKAALVSGMPGPEIPLGKEGSPNRVDGSCHLLAEGRLLPEVLRE